MLFRRQLFIKLIFLTSTFSFASDIYIAQVAAGANNGSSCANARAVSTLAAGDWTAGNIIHLCGTITSSITAAGNGASGNVITLKFEAGAKMSQPANSLLEISNHSFIVVDGGTNGIMENTANGTSLANHVATRAIDAQSCDFCEVKNLTIQNFYVHVANNDNNGLDASQLNCILYSGDTFLIHDNTMHDAGWCLYMNGGNAHNQRVYNNNIFNIDHAIAITPDGSGSGTSTHAITGPWYFYNNHVHDYANWDPVTASINHHDGIHCYTVPAGWPLAAGSHAFGADWQDMWIYNNLFDGNSGGNETGHIFLEPGVQTDGTATPCFDGPSKVHIFGNVMEMNSNDPNGILDMGHTTWDPLTVAVDFYNNSIWGQSASGGRSAVFEQVNTVNAINNIIGGQNKLWDGVSFTNTDFNGYINCPTGTSFNCWPVAGGSNNFSTWLSNCGCDSHAVNSQANFDGVNSTTGVLSVGSVMIGKAKNLTSTVTTWPTEQQNALFTDRAGDPRGSIWDIGALSSQSPAASANPAQIFGSVTTSGGALIK